MKNALRESAFDRIGKRKLGPLPEKWEFYKWRWIGDDALLMTGAEYRLITRGKNKGQPKWFGPSREIVVTKAEADAEDQLRALAAKPKG